MEQLKSEVEFYQLDDVVGKTFGCHCKYADISVAMLKNFSYVWWDAEKDVDTQVYVEDGVDGENPDLECRVATLKADLTKRVTFYEPETMQP